MARVGRFGFIFYVTLTLAASLGIALIVLSGRYARRSADTFVGVTIARQYPYMRCHLGLWGLNTRDEGMGAPKWTFRYGTAFDEGFDVEVSLYGKVTGCTVRELNELIGLSEGERIKRKDDFVSGWSRTQ
jgi:hypothetical protein